MPRTPSIIDAVTFTVRLPSAHAKWLMRQGKDMGNAALFVRQLVSDAMDFFGMPGPIREALEADAKRMGKSQREYVIDCLTRRYEELLKEKFQRATGGQAARR